jgi:putative transposase
MNTIFGPNRRSIRLKGYDYHSAGAYFITICVQDRSHLFGHIAQEKMILSPAGEMIAKEWERLSDAHRNIDLDEFIVMPNHFHGIVLIGFDLAPHFGQTQGLPLQFHGMPSLSDLIREFKSLSTVKYIQGVRNNDWAPFQKRLWQRNYHERIIRNERQLNHTREYIKNNPLNWESDPENVRV